MTVYWGHYERFKNKYKLVNFQGKKVKKYEIPWLYA